MKKEFSKITVDSVGESLKKAVDQAQIRQKVTTVYPAAKVGNSAASALFGVDEYGLPDGQEYTSERVTWIDIPKGYTKEQVAKRLKELPKARIYRKISNNLMDVLTEEQKSMISNGTLKLSEVEDKRTVRNSEGDIVMPLQYAQNFFNDGSAGIKEDEDYRTSVKSSTFIPVKEEDLHS